jgi:uncharacterized membrane protein YdfJ with MMPL/SSD domain
VREEIDTGKTPRQAVIDGLASAILIAGSMVCVLLPAVMLLMGGRTWWVPRWLDRFLPHISVEGQAQPQPA